jgi:TolB-like protein/DNA-binding winged helix-turn-helix (wHTH) protein/cytochrome c-type biogenesis protein CcmH/NrfG
MAPPAQKLLRFGEYNLDPNTASLRRGDKPLALRPKSFDVLLFLARNPGRVVSKDELIKAVWTDVVVTDNSLVQCISDIRLALEDETQEQLKTVARRGYLFTGPVGEVEPQARAPRSRRPAWLVGAGAGLLILAAWAAVHFWRASPELDAALPAGKRVSIAVLPFTTLDASADDEYFAGGLTEDIVAALGRFSELSVLSPRAASAYKGKAAPPKELGRDLGVRYIAEGSVRRVPGRVRVAVRLTDAADGTLLWADQYDAEPERIFAIQDNITREIAGALAVRLSGAEQARAVAKPPRNLEAYDLVLRGRDQLSRLSRSATSNARAQFERAIELDPAYSPAYVGLARVDLTAVALGWTPDPAGALHRAENLARKAIELDEFNASAHVLLGKTYSRLGEYDRAIDALKRAMALNPSDPDTYAGMGDALLWTGEIASAIQSLETAERLDPKLSTEDLFDLGTAYFLAGRNAEAIRVFERTVTRNDSTLFIRAMLAASYAESGRKEEAARVLAETRRLYPYLDLASFGSLFRKPEHRKRIVAALRRAGF